MRFSSLEAKLALMLTGAAVVAAIAIAVLIFPLLWLAHTAMQPIRRLLRALSGSVASYRDGDFSISLRTRRRDELGELIVAHNELGHALREQRQNIVQRELLLDTVVQHTPTALVLTDAGDHIVYANLAARHLFNEGKS